MVLCLKATSATLLIRPLSRPTTKLWSNPAGLLFLLVTLRIMSPNRVVLRRSKTVPSTGKTDPKQSYLYTELNRRRKMNSSSYVCTSSKYFIFVLLRTTPVVMGSFCTIVYYSNAIIGVLLCTVVISSSVYC